MEAGEDVVDVLLSSDGSWEKIKDHSHPEKDALMDDHGKNETAIGNSTTPNQNISSDLNLTVDSYMDLLMTDADADASANATTSLDNIPADNRK